MKKTLAFILALFLCIGLCACGISEKSAAFKEQIQAIGIVSLESEQKLLAAEEAYKALGSEEKAEVLEDLPTLVKARITYDALVDDATRQKVADDAQKRVDNVIQKIDAIGTVSLESRDVISDARNSYSLLNEEEQERVTNITALDEAETELTNLRNALKSDAIEKYKDKFNLSEDIFSGTTFYKPKNTPKYVDTRSYIIPYIGIQKNQAWIVIVYNYTGDNWIFWKDITFLVDGEKYTKSFSGINRDARYGIVVESYQELLDVGQAMDTEDIELLQAIANSNETIVRFSGDRVYDLTISQKDKDMIKDVLALYSAFAN